MMKGVTLQRRLEANSCQMSRNNTLDLMRQLRSKSLLILKASVVTLSPDEIYQSVEYQPICNLPQTFATPSSSYPQHPNVPSMPRPVEFLQSMKGQHFSGIQTLEKKIAMSFRVNLANETSI